MAEQPAPALQAIGLSKRFGGLAAVSNVSLDLRVGEIHAVIGPNGAGKSTLINLLSGDLTSTDGEIKLGDRDLTHCSPEKRALYGVGRSYQKTTIFPRFTTRENVRLAAQSHMPSPLNCWRSPDRNPQINQTTQHALARAGLSARAEVTAMHLSHGEQRQLEVAMVLATHPRVMLLDEPLAGMGHAEARSMIRLIGSLKHDCALLVVEHDMDAVFELADRLTVMADGHVIASGLPADIRADAAVRAAYLGEDEVMA
jgi:branched-chain amino acid transport system ATP-binding protein